MALYKEGCSRTEDLNLEEERWEDGKIKRSSRRVMGEREGDLVDQEKATFEIEFSAFSVCLKSQIVFCPKRHIVLSPKRQIAFCP